MEKLSRYLKSENITNTDFAKRLGVAPSTVTRLISGERSCSIKTAQKIEQATNGKIKASVIWNERLTGKAA